MSVYIELVREEVSNCMDRILKQFKPGAKVTVVVRNPKIPGDTDFILTSDDLDETIKAIQRQQQNHPKPASSA